VSVLRQNLTNQISSAGHLLLVLVGAKIGTKGGWVFVLLLIACLSLVLWIMNYRRARAVGDTPTSRIASAPQGYVELAGVARPFPGDRLVSPVSRIHCVWYHYIIEEKRGDKWRKVKEEVSHDSFMIEDGSGEALIDPDFAEIHSIRKRTWRAESRRYQEWLLVPGEPLYVIGEFVTEGGQSSQLDPQADLNAVLARWKADKADLMRRFDLDGNGEIDLKEWELARKAARREVQRQHQEIRSQPGVHTLRKPRDGRHFLISNLDPDRLARRYGMWTTIQLTVAVLSGAGGLLVLTSMAR
jgi:hypothetical protein